MSGQGDADAVTADSKAIGDGTLRQARALEEANTAFRRHRGQIDQNHEEEQGQQHCPQKRQGHHSWVAGGDWDPCHASNLDPRGRGC